MIQKVEKRREELSTNPLTREMKENREFGLALWGVEKGEARAEGRTEGITEGQKK